MSGRPIPNSTTTFASTADRNWNLHRLTPTEKERFKQDGFLVLADQLPEAVTNGLEEAFDSVIASERVSLAASDLELLNVPNFLSRDERLLEMIDWPMTFPKAFDLLGWNIQVYHTHMIFTPGTGQGADPIMRSWHQDSDRLNHELGPAPQPRVSLKVGFFLTDCLQTGSGNFAVVPGSHLNDSIINRNLRHLDPPGATEVLVPRGGIVLFDRRIWHTGSPNYTGTPRKVLFYGYSYRWLRPRDNMTIDHLIEKCDPIRRQLLGDCPSGGYGYTSPNPQDVPLRAWMEQHPCL